MRLDIDELDARQVLLAVERARRDEMAAQAETLALAAHWCDLHGQMSYDRHARADRGEERLVGLGGEGTPDVEEFAAAEFGAMRHQHPMAARNLMADALDLRHRLPRTWAAVQELRVEVWLARKVAGMTRHLSRTAAGFVDRAVADSFGALPAGRLLALVEARVIEADPQLAESQEQIVAAQRYVRTTRDEHGLMTLIARATAGDAMVFDAMVDRIAEILAERGDADPVQVRRSKAVGVLGHPARALQMLLESAHEAGIDDRTAETELTGQTDHPEDDSEEEHRRREEESAPVPSLRDLLGAVTGDAARPPVRLFVHLHQTALTESATTAGASGHVARVEGLGPVTVDQVREWLGHSAVTLTPVLDLADQHPVDGYEFPHRLREAAQQLHPADPFPWSVSTGRRRDADHCTPYLSRDRGGPPGQTGMHNLALLTRHHHRIKTFGGWQLTCESPGRYVWRSPHGFWFRVDERGTHHIGEMVSARGAGRSVVEAKLSA
jgi:hypothetical protein